MKYMFSDLYLLNALSVSYIDLNATLKALSDDTVHLGVYAKPF